MNVMSARNTDLAPAPDPAPVSDDSRLTAVGLLVEAYEGLMGKLDPQIAAHGLTRMEFGVLIRIARSPHGRLRMNDLACQVGLSTSGTTRAVDRLERTGLVTRTTCASDRRGYFADLTPAGLAKVEEILPGHLELIDRWYTGLLDSDKYAAHEDALRTLREAVRPGATAGAVATVEG